MEKTFQEELNEFVSKAPDGEKHFALMGFIFNYLGKKEREKEEEYLFSKTDD